MRRGSKSCGMLTSAAVADETAFPSAAEGSAKEQDVPNASEMFWAPWRAEHRAGAENATTSWRSRRAGFTAESARGAQGGSRGARRGSALAPPFRRTAFPRKSLPKAD